MQEKQPPKYRNIPRMQVLFVDEGTASVDPQTDALMQQTIAQRFRGRTVVTIAHRCEVVNTCLV